MALSLVYQQQIVTELVEEDGLLIMGRGLGLRRMLCILLQIYAEPQNLVILINTSPEDVNSIQDELACMGVKKPGLRVIKWDTTPEESYELCWTLYCRNEIYRRGGIIAVTSRILAVDMLVERIPTHIITGILDLPKFERSLDYTDVSGTEQGKEGFIKAFSDQPEPFVTGFAPLQNMLKTLLLRKVYLWPRYQLTVAECLEKEKPDVVELNPQLSDSMLKIQNAITECMDTCLREVKRNNPTVEIEELAAQNVMFKAFDAIIRRQLDPVWHRVGMRTKQLIVDIKSLRKLQTCLETILADSTRLEGNPYRQQSPWLFTEAASTIFSVAKERVYLKEVEFINTKPERGIPPGIKPILEECPKWQLLANIMEEIEFEIEESILIMVNDEHTSSQLKEYLSTMEEEKDAHSRSGTPVLKRLLQNHFRWKNEVRQYRRTRYGPTRILGDERYMTVGGSNTMRGSGTQPPNKRRRVRGRPATVGNIITTLPTHAVQVFEHEVTEMADYANAGELPLVEAEKEHSDAFDPEQFSNFFGLVALPSVVVIRRYQGDTDDRMLAELKPRFIVMYDPDPAFIRRIEVYRASNPGVAVRVYFMAYDNSIEAQLFLSSVRKENEAFQRLIREKSVMAIPIQENEKKNIAGEDIFLKTLDTRVAGGRRITVSGPPKVSHGITESIVNDIIVVDIREFKCSLPPTLHAHGFTILPYTLQVGDYILNPNMCVERKSIQDLIGSFSTGRLYDQCVEMHEHYKIPILLIEFDGEKSFSLKDLSDMKTDVTDNDLQAKLVMLMMSFPKLRIIWSSSPHETAVIFEDLKTFEVYLSILLYETEPLSQKNYEEPDGETTARVGLEAGESYQENSASQMAKELLRSLPGVSSQNWKILTNSVESIERLSKLHLDELQGIIGVDAGKELYDFLNYQAEFNV
ncbi:hypothetical protein BC938DRAFT_483143 [Jimgerdemannia flammicorona]|uniref:ERCC4 domain-containing protein n=1 Tax=Jimgerdemannia flammicorona TaxID=994334 RepID=A0A433QCH9_9FUNG|nr:hypothetical protein BC938DRAFT_483143 [Jimgerdemannia flammicorona]